MSVWSVVAAVSLHVILGLLVVQGWASADYGGGGSDDRAVQVDIISVAALQAPAHGEAIADAPETERPADAQDDTGGEDDANLAAEAGRQRFAPPEHALPIETAEAEPEHASAVDPNSHQKDPPRETKAEPTQESNARSLSPQIAGRATLAGSSQTVSTNHRIHTALKGEISRYNAALWKTIQKGLPRRRGQRGALEVTFTITREGIPQSVRIAVSSGNAALDQAVARAVRASRFAKPPANFTDAHLAYRLPVRFR